MRGWIFKDLIKNSFGSCYYIIKACAYGTTTISMKEGPVSNVPIGITLSDNGNISIMVDPNTTDNHLEIHPLKEKEK